METSKDSSIKDDWIPEQDELSSREYLGTFRWKRSLKFPILQKLEAILPFGALTKWSDYINKRINETQFEPYVIDALSYPLSIIHSLNELILKEHISLTTLQSESLINIIVLGAATKTECRIALESNYFDEIYYALKELTCNPEIKVNLFFVGEEVPNCNSYDSNTNKNFKYIFSNWNTGAFLKENIMNFNKKNTYLFGLNCGFGAGYWKLTKSWFSDWIKLIKLNFYVVFTYTNDYEDKKGEIAIVKDKLGGNIILYNDDNPFKSMTTYKSETNENSWACGHYGFYVLYGGDRKTVTQMGKLGEKEIEDVIKKTINIKA